MMDNIDCNGIDWYVTRDISGIVRNDTYCPNAGMQAPPTPPLRHDLTL